MALTTDNIKYAVSTTIGCTIASLSSSSSTARGSATVTNSANLYVDAMLYVAVKTGTGGALANDKACYVYLYGSEDGTNYTGSSAEAEGSDAAVTLDSPTNLKGPYVITCATNNTTYKLVIGSVAASFGGILPRVWGFVLQNYTGQNLDGTESNHTKSYTGITYTNQ